jgi:hypothetical protein
LPGQSYQETSLDLYPGDAMVLATDGITDRLASATDLLGERALLKRLAAARTRRPTSATACWEPTRWPARMPPSWSCNCRRDTAATRRRRLTEERARNRGNGAKMEGAPRSAEPGRAWRGPEARPTA